MFKENLKKLRAQKGITQENFAKEINVTKGAVAMWETGKRMPDIGMLKTIAAFFDVTVDSLVGASVESNTTSETTKDDIKFALFGTTDVDDELYDDVKKLAQTLYISKQNRKEKNDKLG